MEKSNKQDYHPLIKSSSSPSEFTDDYHDDARSSTAVSATSDEAVLLRHQRSWMRRCWVAPSRLLATLLALLCFLLSTLIVLVVVRLNPSDQQCARQLSMWCKFLSAHPRTKIITKSGINETHPVFVIAAPAMEAVEYITVDFDDAFNSTSIYRGLPTPEREEAWFNLTYSMHSPLSLPPPPPTSPVSSPFNLSISLFLSTNRWVISEHAFEIPEDKIRGLNRTEEDHLKHVPPEVGTGYVALLEVFHQLHCLNMIRMYTWYQAGKYPGIPMGLSDSELKNRIHVDHCLEALRISLMCWADITPLFVRLGGPAGARADFNTHHKCRNFAMIEDWVDNNWTVL